MTVLEKQPSPELLSLIKAAAQSLLGFGELWNSIKMKGRDEGFSEKELQDILRPLLKPQLSKNQIYSLFHREEEKERSKENRNAAVRVRDVQPNNGKKELEQNKDKKDPPPEKPTETPAAPPPPDEPPEDPKDAEIAYWKEKAIELEDALHKTEQFKPATQLQEPTTDVYREEHYFNWLKNKDNGVSCYWYDGYGIELFKSRILSQLKSKGVTTFKRLYFEV